MASPVIASGSRLEASNDIFGHLRMIASARLRDCHDEMFAIVEDEQRLLFSEETDDGVEGLLPGADRKAEQRCDVLRDELRVRQWRQFDQPNAVVIPIQHLRRDLQRRAGLADPARADERDEPMLIQERLDLAPFRSRGR